MHIVGERRCIVCREHHLKNEMIRISKSVDKILVGDTKKVVGRGVYICKSTTCLDLAIKKRMLNKAFSCIVPDEIYEQLRGYIE